MAYALDAVPMNLLSVSALMKKGATLHFEDHFENDEGNSWLQHPDMPTREAVSYTHLTLPTNREV